MNAKHSKKLEGNGMWESSRMMLPEHKAALAQHVETARRRSRIELDEQECQLISCMMSTSLKLRKQISITLFHPFEQLQVIGIVDYIDHLQNRFMVDGEWFSIADIESAQLHSPS